MQRMLLWFSLKFESVLVVQGMYLFLFIYAAVFFRHGPFTCLGFFIYLCFSFYVHPKQQSWSQSFLTSFSSSFILRAGTPSCSFSGAGCRSAVLNPATRQTPAPPFWTPTGNDSPCSTLEIHSKPEGCFKQNLQQVENCCCCAECKKARSHKDGFIVDYYSVINWHKVKTNLQKPM